MQNYIRFSHDPIASASLFGSLGYFLVTPEVFVPVLVLFLSQRFFMQDMVITQIEK